MTASNTHDGTSDDLAGMHILLVEDSWHVGNAMKTLLEVLGAEVSGPAASGAEAERLIAGKIPDLAIVDFHLRDDELATGVIDRLHGLGVAVILLTGYGSLPAEPKNVAAILQKPISESRLLAALRPFSAPKPAP